MYPGFQPYRSPMLLPRGSHQAGQPSNQTPMTADSAAAHPATPNPGTSSQDENSSHRVPNVPGFSAPFVPGQHNHLASIYGGYHDLVWAGDHTHVLVQGQENDDARVEDPSAGAARSTSVNHNGRESSTEEQSSSSNQNFKDGETLTTANEDSCASSEDDENFNMGKEKSANTFNENPDICDKIPLAQVDNGSVSSFEKDDTQSALNALKLDAESVVAKMKADKSDIASTLIAMVICDGGMNEYQTTSSMCLRLRAMVTNTEVTSTVEEECPRRGLMRLADL